VGAIGNVRRRHDDERGLNVENGWAACGFLLAAHVAWRARVQRHSEIALRPLSRSAAHMADSNPTRVLVVDDDAVLLLALPRRFKREVSDFVVDTARGGREAIRMLESGDYRIVVTDIVMPEQDGLGLIMENRRTRPAVRIIAMSGVGLQAGTGYFEMARRLGARKVLAKPIRFEVFVAAIRDALDDGGARSSGE
jgi:CheY-like chemotaxis protein